MPLENATTVNELNESNPAATDEIAQGDDHVRMIKQVLKNDFGALDGAFTKTVEELEKDPDPIPPASETDLGLIKAWVLEDTLYLDNRPNTRG